MKLILSRKGFDSSAGGVPSPVFPDGFMYSLPIQAGGARKSYAEIRKGDIANGTDMGSVVEQLTSGRITRDALSHLDPDLDSQALPRLPGWRPCFGQALSAQSHLESCAVGVGDLFVFFGWFRRVVRNGHATWTYDRRSPGLHVIFGWLQVGEVIRVESVGVERLMSERPWLRDHPHMHFARPELRRHNVVYIASDRLVLPGIDDTKLPGAGEMRTFTPQLVLTAAKSKRRALWKLPNWFMPSEDCRCLTYHTDPGRWQQTADGVLLDTVGRGQEFVLDCANRPQAFQWISGLLQPNVECCS